MNARILATCTIGIGAIVLLVGSIMYGNNQPVRFDPAKSGRSVFGGRDDLGNMLQVQTENLRREQRKSSASGIIVLGAAIVIAGAITWRIGKGTHSLRPTEPSESFKTCPFCAETVRAAATVCRFCGREIRMQPTST